MAVQVVDDDAHAHLPVKITEQFNQLLVGEVVAKQRASDYIVGLRLESGRKDVQVLVRNLGIVCAVLLRVLRDELVGIHASQLSGQFFFACPVGGEHQHIAAAATQVGNAQVGIWRFPFRIQGFQAADCHRIAAQPMVDEFEFAQGLAHGLAAQLEFVHDFLLVAARFQF